MSQGFVNAAPSSSNDVKPGTLIDFAGSGALTGYLLCDGSAVSRATYPALFAAIGVLWGAGDGVTTFNLPSLSRRVTIGSGGSGTATIGNAVGNTGGEEAHAQTLTELATHSHSLTSGGMLDQTGAIMGGLGGATVGNRYATVGGSSSLIPFTTSGSSASAGSGVAANIIQPSAIVQKFIKT